jgi:hypothetical protein
MQEYPGERRVVIVLTDAGTNNPTKLKKTVSRLAGDGVAVLHFGIGPGTADTNGCYTHSWGNLDLLDNAPTGFMQTFCRVVMKVARGALGEPDSVEDDVV